MSDAKGDTIQRVLINKKNGMLGLGIRVRYHDKYHAEDVSLGPGPQKGYTLRLEPEEFDCWAIFSGDENNVEFNGPWLLVPGLKTEIEDLGPL